MNWNENFVPRLIGFAFGATIIAILAFANSLLLEFESTFWVDAKAKVTEVVQVCHYRIRYTTSDTFDCNDMAEAEKLKQLGWSGKESYGIRGVVEFNTVGGKPVVTKYHSEYFDVRNTAPGQLLDIKYDPWNPENFNFKTVLTNAPHTGLWVGTAAMVPLMLIIILHRFRRKR